MTKEGRMTLSIINDGVIWSVFGDALPEVDAGGEMPEQVDGR